MYRGILFLSLRGTKQSMLLKLSISIFLIYFSYKSQKCVIWRNHIEHLFPTFSTFLTNHIPFIFPIIHSDRLHKSMTCCKSISWFFFIYMLGIETIRTMIARTSLWMKSNFFLTKFAREWFISHNKTHKPQYREFYRKEKCSFFAKKDFFC